MTLLKGVLGACVIATSLLNSAYAQEGDTIKPAKKHYWLETSFLRRLGGGGALGLHLNMHTDKHNWTLGYNSLHQSFVFVRDPVDRATGNSINGNIKAYSVSKLWHWPYRLGYASVSVGGSLLKGRWGVNCARSTMEGFGRSEECDLKQFVTLGIPLRATASFGRYVGIGYVAEMNINAKDSYILLGMTIPIGGFTR
ncbi:hypothetical protein [Marinagarivorans algicola]|uniref:hypothetical protein n=1 Tax=Marinagarivorans algicola TaxID=1513270 RepID=UPI003736E303